MQIYTKYMQLNCSLHGAIWPIKSDVSCFVHNISIIGIYSKIVNIILIKLVTNSIKFVINVGKTVLMFMTVILSKDNV